MAAIAAGPVSLIYHVIQPAALYTDDWFAIPSLGWSGQNRECWTPVRPAIGTTLTNVPKGPATINQSLEDALQAPRVVPNSVSRPKFLLSPGGFWR